MLLADTPKPIPLTRIERHRFCHPNANLHFVDAEKCKFAFTAQAETHCKTGACPVCI